MAQVTADRVKDTTTTTGTGNITVSGTAPSGFRTLSAVLTADGDTCWACIEGGAEWEVCLLTRVSANVYSRATPLASSNAGAAVSFAAGTKSVFITEPAAMIALGRNAPLAQFFGDGSDGSVTISGSVTLARDMFYNNLTIASGAALNPAGYRIFVKDTLDLTAAPAGGIARNGIAGGNASGATGGSAGSASAGVTVGGGIAGVAGATGTTGAGAAASNPSNQTGNGGGGATSAAAGASGTGNAGAGGNAGSGTSATLFPLRIATTYLLRGAALIGAGAVSRAGGSGGGDGTGLGGGGGGGGAAGPIVAIFARRINRGGSTAAGAISAKGGPGGNGGIGSGGTNRGGGSGGGGGGGGWIYLVFAELLGSAAAAALDVSGGNGGNGGNGTGSGGGGNGGGAATSGVITLFDLAADAASETAQVQAVVNGSAASGATGGGGATAGVGQVNL